MLELNFGDVEPQELLPEGLYAVTVDDVAIEDSKATAGNKNLILSLRVIGPDSIDEGLIGKKIREVVSLAASARWKLQIVLENLTGTEWRADDMKLDPRDLLGLTARVVIFHNPGQKGGVFANVKSWHPNI
jgi:hypothetical protein